MVGVHLAMAAVAEHPVVERADLMHASYEPIPIENRDEWLAAARQLSSEPSADRSSFRTAGH
jgi:hypothetical protein